MRGLIGIYNRNRKLIWLIAGVIIAIISLIHIINNEFELIHKKEENNSNKIISQQFYDKEYSVISSQKSNSLTNDKVIDTIEQFIEYCNKKDIQNAYNMLSLDCKEVLYPTLEEFETKYYKTNFNEAKTYKLQSWISYNNLFIYKVDLLNDMINTGIVSNAKKQDYYTVVKEKDNYYLNISGFIEKNIINSTKKENSIDITIKSEEVFIDYLNLNIIVNNNTKNEILLDSGKKGDTVFVSDSENINYVSYLFESNNYELVIPMKTSKNFKIKFMKNYKVDRPIKSVSFEDVVLNYENNNYSSSSIKIEL